MSQEDSRGRQANATSDGRATEDQDRDARAAKDQAPAPTAPKGQAAAAAPVSEPEVKHLTPAEFDALDHDAVTLVDLREPDEQVVFSIDGAISAPFSGFPANLAAIPRDRPVVAFCRVGDWSEQVAEILADEGADVATLDGGITAYRAYLAERDGREKRPVAEGQAPAGSPTTATEGHATASAPTIPAAGEEASPAVGATPAAGTTPATTTAPAAPAAVRVDARGLKCPGPIVKVGDAVRAAAPGTVFDVEATEDAFCSDIAVWCERTGNPLLKLETAADGTIHVRLRKGDGSGLPAPGAAGASGAARASALPADVQTGHDKTFVVFSGDLDKTIAAFIIANGAAAMGRKVTMFFTFWGLNILRRPNKVQVAKGTLERMFCAMMPRGTLRLGLSRMNMLGIGPKMIRFMMRKKGIASLEELIGEAQAHGVRIVACQMSMDIMGITKEELLDGVELGGVATFLGSGETSDMSLFI